MYCLSDRARGRCAGGARGGTRVQGQQVPEEAPLAAARASARGTWVEGAGISCRPLGADGWAVSGYWEDGLVVGTDGATCLVTLVERSTRFLLASTLCEHITQTVVGRLAEMVAGLTEALRRTLTWG